MSPDETPQRRRRKALFAMCNAFGLTRADRMEIAAHVLNRELDSYKDLDEREVLRLLDALTGAVWVATILTERRKGERV